jgi:hypothetical protein
MPHQFKIGGNDDEFLELTVTGYERPLSGEYDDDNWLNTTVIVKARGFQGKATPSLQTWDLSAFLKELIALNQTLTGTATINPIEDQLSLSVECDKQGHVTVSGYLLDTSMYRYRLTFTFEIDQTFLTQTIQDLREVCDAFPTRGTPWVAPPG